MAEEQHKVTVTLPRSLLTHLDERVPKRQRSRFIVEAIHERLALVEQDAALEETAGAWSQDRHPDLLIEADIDRWLRDLRRGWS